MNQPQQGLNQAFVNLQAPATSASQPPDPVRAADPVWKLGRVLLRRETAHRRGKAVIVVYDFASHLPLSIIERLAKTLRQACGCGGSVRERTIELQGDQPAKIRAILEAEGFAVGGIR